MTLGVKQHVAVRVTVHSRQHGELHFGLASGGFPGGSVPRTGDGADLGAVAWSRALGQPGRLIFGITGRVYGPVGLAWSEVINPNDTVELRVRYDVSPEEDGERSRDWYTEFVGEVRTVKLSNDDATIECQDAMGRLSYEHFAYWRNLGQVVDGENGPQGEDVEKRLSDFGGSEALKVNSIAGSAEAIFKALIYTRVGKRVRWKGETVRWKDLHAYRFESDDQDINMDLQSLAPEGSSWMDAVGWAVDAPEFYEFYLDNVPKDELRETLKNGGVVAAGVSRPQQVRLSEEDARITFLGDRIERFVIRPVPFPTYDPERGGYRSAAWDGLRTTVAWDFGVQNVNTARNGDHIFSVYSVDLVQGTGNAESSENAISEAQVVVDGERYAFHTGYRPLDAKSKRTGTAGGGAETTNVELSRTLAWQLASFHHFNDRFYSGTITSIFDPRPRLGERYVCEGYLYYVEGYEHSIDPAGTTTNFTVTRGLTLPQYGVRIKGAAVHTLGRAAEETVWRGEWKLFPDFLGRQRPGEEYPLKLQDVSDNKYLEVIGQHESFTP